VISLIYHFTDFQSTCSCSKVSLRLCLDWWNWTERNGTKWNGAERNGMEQKFHSIISKV